MSELRRIGSFAKVRRGASPRPIWDPQYFGGNVGWVRIGDVTKYNYKYLRITEQYLSPLGQSKSVTVGKGDLIMSICATVGKPIIVDMAACIHDGFVQLYDLTDVDTEYLFYQLQFHEKAFESRGQPGTQVNLNTKIVEDEKIWLPDGIDKQKKIAKIISTIDRTITHTEALIEKYQQIKAGLMHDLFTRGIGADGQLRPPREQAPELYWESAIGWIPKEWIFATCLDVCEKVIDCKNRTPPIMPDGYPVIRTPNVRNGLFIDDELVFTDYYSYSIWTARGKPEPEDIVITREAPVGEVCKIPKRHQSACLGQRMMLYRTDPAKIINDYFLYVLQSKAVQNRLDLISGGSTVGHVRVGDIRGLWIFYPESKSEQLKIAEALNRISGKIENEINQLNKLKMQKSGLMHDLLTGKVQVTIQEAT